MKRIAVLAALLAMAWTTPALAGSCPTDMKEIDEALAKGTKKLSAGDLEKVKKFRAEGEKLHKAGKHQESIDTLEKAKVILGI
jgi:hypothetical protein